MSIRRHWYWRSQPTTWPSTFSTITIIIKSTITIIFTIPTRSRGSKMFPYVWNQYQAGCRMCWVISVGEILSLRSNCLPFQKNMRLQLSTPRPWGMIRSCHGGCSKGNLQTTILTDIIISANISCVPPAICQMLPATCHLPPATHCSSYTTRPTPAHTCCETHTFDNHTQRLVLPSFPLFWGGAGFHFGFTPYLLSVSTSFCKCISLFQSSLYHSASTSIGSLPSNWPLDVLRQLSKPTTCPWIFQYMRSGSVKAMAYQRSMSEVPSSGCLKIPAKRECWDKHSVQAIWTDYDGLKTRYSGTSRRKYKKPALR